MTISVVQTAVSGTFSASAAFGSAVTAGSSVILVAAAFGTTGSTITSSSPTLGGSTPAGSILLQSQVSPGGNNVYEGIWLLPNVPGGATSLGVTFGGGGSAVGVIAYEVAGLGTSPALDQASSGSNPNSGAISSGTTPAITSAPEFIVGSGVGFSLTMASPPAPWTASAISNDFFWAAWQIATSAGGTYTYTQSSGGTASWAAGVATIETATAPPPTAPSLLIASFP